MVAQAFCSDQEGLKLGNLGRSAKEEVVMGETALIEGNRGGGAGGGVGAPVPPEPPPKPSLLPELPPKPPPNSTTRF